MFWHGKGRATLLKYEYQITRRRRQAQARPNVSCPHTTGCAKAIATLGQPLHAFHFWKDTFQPVPVPPPARPSVRMAEHEEEGLINSAEEFHQMVFWNSVRGEVVNDPVLTGFAHMVSWEFHAYLITCPSSTDYSSSSCLLGLNKVTMNKPFNRIQYITPITKPVIIKTTIKPNNFHSNEKRSGIEI